MHAHATFARLLRRLETNQLPRAQDVRLAELINACRYKLPDLEGELPIHSDSEIGCCPWNPDHELVRITYRTRARDEGELPATHFVMLVDQSGSLQRGNLVVAIQKAMGALTDRLRAIDRVTILCNTQGQTRSVLEAARGDDHVRMQQVLRQRSAYGNDIGAAELRAAHALLARDSSPAQHIVLVTDGGAEDAQFANMTAKLRRPSTRLSVLDVRPEQHDDAALLRLTELGGGGYGHIDTPQTAKQTVAKLFSGWLSPAVRGVRLTATFDAKVVRQYRLLGFDNHAAPATTADTARTAQPTVPADWLLTALYEIERHDPATPFAARPFSIGVHCLDPNGKPMILNHDSWSSYASMPRPLSQNGMTAATAAAVGLLLQKDRHCELLQPALLLTMAEQIDADLNPELRQLVAATVNAMREAASGRK